MQGLNNMKAFDPAMMAQQKMLDENIAKQIEGQNKLFIAFLKNQTPDDKADTQQMMQSILSMMQATQQMQGNKLLKDSLETQKDQFNLSMGQYLGRRVEHKTNQIHFTGEGNEIRLELPENVRSAKIVITNQDGEKVDGADLDHRIQKQRFNWTGKLPDGSTAPAGVYHVSVISQTDEIDYTTGNYKQTFADTYIKNFIDSISFNDENNPVLFAGKIEVDPKDVLSVQKVVRPKPYYNVLQEMNDEVATATESAVEDVTNRIAERI